MENQELNTVDSFVESYITLTRLGNVPDLVRLKKYLITELFKMEMEDDENGED